ncbi:MAG: PKD domain-containing protein [Flavobacteriales bacterium]|jgi:gliding motility-associated-like protein|nr:PKD domain-containing protein [Flavobacteriales bacterium]
MNNIRVFISALLGILVWNIQAQQGCDLNAIRTAFTNAGCTELPSCQSSCSMYFYNPQSLSGVAAQQFAESLGANLISVQSAAENNCISTALTNNGFGGVIWIGFTDENSEGNYYWYDGSPVIYTNWRAGEPNNSGGNENCTQIFPDGLWNDLNCGGYTSKSVIEVGLCPQITASNDTTICNTTSASLVCSDALFGSAPYTYTWSDGQTGQAITVTPSVTTTYTVTATDRYGCFVTEDVVVNVINNIDANFTSSEYCVYEPVQFLDASTVVAPDNINGYFWEFGDGAFGTGASTTYQYATAGTYTVKYGITSDLGCIDSVEQTITIYNPPSADFNFNNGCPNATTTFEDNSAGNGTIITAWEWDFGDNSGVGSNSIESYTYTLSGNYDVELIIEDDQGCRDTVVHSVQVYEEPQVTFNFVNSCLYDETNFVDASIVTAPDNIVSWSWDVDGDNIEDYTTQNVDHLYTLAGDYDVTLTVETNNGCTNSLTQLISKFPVPQAGFSASTTCVNGDPTQFVNTSSIASGSIILNGWDFGDGNTSTQTTPTNNYTIAASYPVTLGVLSDNGCVDSVTYSVDVLGKPTAAFTQDTTGGCPIMCVAFTDTSYDDVAITTWSWKFENNYGESNEQFPSYCYTTSGTYDVGLAIVNAQGCKDTLLQTSLITIHETPVSDFTLSPTSTDVQNATITFTNSSTDAAAWSWDFGDGSGNNYSDYDPSHLYGDSGRYEIQLIVYNASLCSDTSYQFVEILPVDDIFVPSAFSPNGDGKNDILYARGFIGVMYFAVFDRLGNKVFESEDKEQGWDGMINGKAALGGVYTWYLQAEVNGNAYQLKGDVTLIR